jgi:hypothetical protein
MAKRTEQNNQPEEAVAVQTTVSVTPEARTDLGGAVAGGATAPRRVVIKSPEVQYVKSRFAHRAAIRAWKLSRLMLGRRAY